MFEVFSLLEIVAVLLVGVLVGIIALPVMRDKPVHFMLLSVMTYYIVRFFAEPLDRLFWAAILFLMFTGAIAIGGRIVQRKGL
jgi:hypothetical protein